MYKFVLPKVIEVLPLYTIAGWDVYGMEIIVASIALGAFGYFNVKGTGLSGRMQFFFASVMVIAVVLITILVGADRKSTRLNSSHVAISYAVFCLKKKKKNKICRFARH